MKKIDDLNWNDPYSYVEEVIEIWGTLSADEKELIKVRMQKADDHAWESLPEDEKEYWQAGPSHPHELPQIFLPLGWPVFLEFQTRLESLQRFYHHSKKSNKEYLSESLDFFESLDETETCEGAQNWLSGYGSSRKFVTVGRT